VLIGGRLGPYEVLDKLGEGGMGEVYRARDTRLGRDVALKVLPDAFAHDPDRLARFTREAQTLASLNHPNIAHIHGLEESGGVRALVMELVEGEDLSQRMARLRAPGAPPAPAGLPLDEVVPIAQQIAAALEAAHEQSIIHRDLKPANIKVRSDGTVKVLDFGLAKALAPAGAGARDVTYSPTITSPAMTAAGTLLGTAAYMSPEQARGQTVDKRADIWAFGAVLFEMLTGQRAFKGEDTSEVIASVLRDTPDRNALPAATPPAVRGLLARCLERDPRLRLRDIGEARVILGGIGTPDEMSTAGGMTAAAPIGARRRRGYAQLLWFAAGFSVAAAFAVAAVWFPRDVRSADAFPYRLDVTDQTNPPTGVAALSPDGRTLVYVARVGKPPGTPMLFARRLDQSSSRMIPGTENAGLRTVWWSPDSRSIGFFANRRKLMKVPVDGGAPVALADIADEGGGTWSVNGDIIIGSGVIEGLQGLLRINGRGGSLQPLTRIDPARKELSHQWPVVLADGTSVLFTIWYGASDTAELAITSLDDGMVTPLGVTGTTVLGIVDERIIFARSDGAVMAVPIDVPKRRTSGPVVTLMDELDSGEASRIRVTPDGALVYAPRADSARQLLWVDRSATTRPAVGERRGFLSARISPDGRRVAASIDDDQNGASIWIYDVANGTLTPLTDSVGARNPVWSPDGSRILYVSTQGGRAAIWSQLADGSAAPTLSGVPPHNAWNIDLAPDGVTAVYNAIYDNGTFNLESYSLAEPHAARDVAASPRATEVRARVSPDGKLVAYQSDESGRGEIYVRSFPDGGGRAQISSEGGQFPVWARDASVLYYWHDGRIMAATLARETPLRVTSREVVIQGPFQEQFDVAPDGSRFLVFEPQTAGVTLVVIPHWRTELRRLLGTVR
jgi:eukaryotic-like serine/threonine-protein kinase